MFGGAEAAVRGRAERKQAAMKAKGLAEAEQFDEGTSAKRMRVIRKHLVSGKPIEGKVADFMQRSFKKKIYKNKEKFGGETPAVLGRARLKQAAMKAKGLAEGYKKLMRLKGKAYATKNPKIARAAAEQEAKYAASKARRGGASAEAVKGGGSMLGKKGKYTQKAANLAAQRDKAIKKFGAKGIKGYRLVDRAGAPTKRERQQAQAAFERKGRSGDYGQDNQNALRIRYRDLKRRGLI